MGKKEKIPPPGNKKDEYTNFLSKAKWKQAFGKVQLEIPGKNIRAQGALIIGNAIAKNKIISTIDLSSNHIGDRGATELAQILKVNESIVNVILACNEITDIGGIALSSAFIPCANPTGAASQWNRTVSYINLSGNQCGNDTMIAMCNAAAVHKDLTRVDLTNNHVGGPGLKSLARCLQRNQFVTFVLAGNEIGDDGAAYLAQAWKRFGGKGAQGQLNLMRNDISKTGGEALGELLADNDFVTEVNLAQNALGHLGARDLLSPIVLTGRSVVRVLNLSHNRLGDGGALEVARLIESNFELLERLDISHNDIRDEGGIAIAKAMEKNTKLHNLLLAGNAMGGRACEQWKLSIPNINQPEGNLKIIDVKKNNFDDSMQTDLSKVSKDCKFRVDPGPMAETDVLYLEKLKVFLEAEAERKAAEANKKGKKKAKEK